jgi:2-haloacid dehalogenase
MTGVGPAVAIFDVNETLSDMSPLAARFEGVGAPGHLLASWFAATLRDGIALTASGGYADFRDVGRAALTAELAGVPELRKPVDEAADHVLDGFGALEVHPDVPDGLRLLQELEVRIATLTNGNASIARGLLERAGLDELVERHIDVTEVSRWKPAPEPYRHACRALGVGEGDAVLIAVHPWDIQGAERAGLNAAWLKPDGTAYPAVFAPPDAMAADLPALVRALAS